MFPCEQDAHIGKWNAELVRMAGSAARLLYDVSLSRLPSKSAVDMESIPARLALMYTMLEETKASHVGPLLRQVRALHSS